MELELVGLGDLLVGRTWEVGSEESRLTYIFVVWVTNWVAGGTFI